MKGHALKVPRSSPPRAMWSGVALLIIALMSGCDSNSPGEAPTDGTPATGETPVESGSPVAPTSRRGETPEPSVFRFAEVAKEAGIDFVHVSGMTPERYFPTANGSGIAIFDYDNDGLLDLYFASNCYLPLGSRPEGRNRLFKNLGGMEFRDVTEESGLGFHGFCHGVVAADFDNDGDQDVFLATFHQNTFFVNNGDGTFREAGRAAGVAPAGFRGRIAGGGGSDRPIVVDAVGGLKWRVDGGEPSEDLTLRTRPGQRIVFRQADTEAPRGLEILADAGLFRKLDEEKSDKPNALLVEVGPQELKESRLYRAVPPIAEGGEPAVMAELVVEREIDDKRSKIGFECSEHRTAWSSGGAPIDYDGDGDLDLYVSNYGFWTVEDHGDKFCGNVEKNIRQYCSPTTVTTVRHIFYRNDGVVDGVTHFTDVTDEAGVNRADGHGFGIVVAELDGDEKGLPDIYVANDQNPAFLYLNNGDGTFRDVTEICGAGYSEKGAAQSGMGVDAGDVDNDGRFELLRTNFAGEYNTLYANYGNGMFYDQTAAYNLAAAAMPWVGWGCALADLDNDGWLDIFITNGHVDNNLGQLGQVDTPYEEPPLLHRNVALGDGPGASRRFVLATRGAGPYFESSHVGRGAAFGDLDNDGDVDIVVNHKDGPAAVLRNDTPTENRWLRIKPRGTGSNRDSVGARVQVIAGGNTYYRERKSGASMESTNDPRVLVGVGPAARVETVIVHWPSGKEVTLQDVDTNREIEVVEPE